MLFVQAGIASGGNRHIWPPSHALHSIYHLSANLVRPTFWIYTEYSHFLSLPPSLPQSNLPSFLTQPFFFFLTFEFVSLLVGILVPWPGVEPVPSAVKVLNPNYWTTREFSLTQTLVMSPFFLLTPIQPISNIKLSDHLKHNPDLICFAGLSRPPYYTIAHSSPLLLSLLFCLIFLHCPHHH